MLPIRSIKDSRQATRPARAKFALNVLDRLQNAVSVDPSVRWVVWDDMHERMRQAVINDGFDGFQRHKDIAPQICGGGGETYLARMRERLGEEMYKFAMSTYRETLCGNPRDLTVVDGTSITRTAMRHLYHLAYLLKFCRNYFGQPVDVVEIGAGFGNLARLMLQYNVAWRSFIVDFPSSNAIQSFYMTEFFDTDQVEAWDNPAKSAKEGNARINYLPPNAVEHFKDRSDKDRPVLLYSTMALTEITEEGQNYYLDHIKPDAVYVFGQTATNALPGGIQLDDMGELSNHAMFHRLSEEFHPVDFVRGDYYSEFLGIRP